MSSQPSVRLSHGVPDAALRVLEAAGLAAEHGSGALRGVEAWLCLLTDRVDRPRLEAAPDLRIVANMAVGTDNVDLVAAEELGIAVSNTPDVLTDATADLTFGLLLAAARGIVAADRYVRAGAFTGWSPSLGVGLDVSGRTLGIVGAGRIGRAVAERARGFSMQVLFCSRSEGLALNDLLERSDYVSLHVPLTPETKHLIGAGELARMRPTAVLINTARGPVVDEAALVRALRGKQIAGAALDVFEAEPRLTPGLAELPNVVLCPHLGSATVDTRNRMAEIAARNVVACLEGKPLPTQVLRGSRPAR